MYLYTYIHIPPQFPEVGLPNLALSSWVPQVGFSRKSGFPNRAPRVPQFGFSGDRSPKFCLDRHKTTFPRVGFLASGSPRLILRVGFLESCSPGRAP